MKSKTQILLIQAMNFMSLLLLAQSVYIFYRGHIDVAIYELLASIIIKSWRKDLQ